MSKNISDMMNEFSDMMHSNNTSNDTSSNSNGFDFSKISPETLNNFANILNSSKDSNNNSNIDINTILKIKNIMEKMNSKNNPRSNLLLSLKPYLKESRRSKVDQYIQLLNMGNIMEAFGNTGGGKQK